MNHNRLKVALIGNENVGKSSLLNVLVGEYTAIVTDMAGTTRDAIRGFVGDFEIVDTPGMHKNSTLLGKHMRKSISYAVQNADVLLYVLDATRFNSSDIQKIENYRDRSAQQAVIVAVNKADMMKMETLYPKLALLQKLDFVRAIVPVSAKTGFNIDVLIKELETADTGRTATTCDDDAYTDQSIKQMSAEIIRGCVIKNTRNEIPHGVAVVITKFIEKSAVVEIHADIICEKETHKPILIGKGGSMLKTIGTQARCEIEKLVDMSVRLYTNVIVRPNWKNDADIVGGS